MTRPTTPPDIIEKIVAMAATQMRNREIAAMLGVSEGVVHKYLALHGLSRRFIGNGRMPHRNATKHATDEAIRTRNDELARMFDEGKTLKEMGAKFGITRERARQIMERMGKPPRLQALHNAMVERRRIEQLMREVRKADRTWAVGEARKLVERGMSIRQAAIELGLSANSGSHFITYEDPAIGEASRHGRWSEAARARRELRLAVLVAAKASGKYGAVAEACRQLGIAPGYGWTILHKLSNQGLT